MSGERRETDSDLGSRELVVLIADRADGAGVKKLTERLPSSISVLLYLRQIHGALAKCIDEKGQTRPEENDNGGRRWNKRLFKNRRCKKSEGEKGEIKVGRGGRRVSKISSGPDQQGPPGVGSQVVQAGYEKKSRDCRSTLWS